MHRSIRIGLWLAMAVALAVGGCGQPVPPHLKPLAPTARALLLAKGMREESPIFIRIFKEESELEVWKARDDGEFALFKTYAICNWSGELGPKRKEGDKQSPEGFYRVAAGQMNPTSQYHLAFNLGYPNAHDRALGRTGKHLMVHGDCRSAGCYAMTDAQIEEIYALAREAFKGGQEAFYVHAYPFRMTEANLARHEDHEWHGFWRNLKEGYDHFEAARRPPKVNVCERRYLVNASFVNESARVEPGGPCPAYERMPLEALPPPPTVQEVKRQPAQTPVPAADPTPSSQWPAPSAVGYRGTTFSAKPEPSPAGGFTFQRAPGRDN